jgi:peptidyl-prolyl cis-trans isomerase SurA
MNTRQSLRRLVAGAALAVALLLPALAHAQVVVVANGSPITELDIQQRTKLMATSTHKPVTRQEVIQDLIDDRLKIARAKMYGLEVSNEQVNSAFETMAKRQGITPQQFTQFLARAGISPEAVKARIRAELTWSELIRGKFQSSLQIGEADVAHVLRERNENGDDVGYIYTLYPITVVAPGGPSDATLAEKRREAEDLRTRFVDCRTGLAIARTMRDVAVREPITRSSADLPQATRDVLAKLEMGHLTTPDVTAQGLQMFALCGKKQTTTDSPLKTQLRDQLFSKRFDSESKRYLEEIRRSAMIEYKQK